MVEVLKLDLGGTLRGAWERHGVLEGDIFGRLTPSQFVATFCKSAQEDAKLDRVEALRQHNDARGRRGLKPAVPNWL